jgi:hypothetical protein
MYVDETGQLVASLLVRAGLDVFLFTLLERTKDPLLPLPQTDIKKLTIRSAFLYCRIFGTLL